MIVCLLNAGECNRPILPKPKTVFIMAPSHEHQSKSSREVLDDIRVSLTDFGYKTLEGSELVRHGDYFCSICQVAQGCALGVALVHGGLPVGTIGNIFLEAGIMQAFGKPVILFSDKKKNLPSDYARNYAIFYNSKKYAPRYRDLLTDIGKLPNDLYEYLGLIAFQAGDYEKAAKYFQEAYLIDPKPETLVRLKEILSALTRATGIPRAYKQRLQENIRYFCSRV